MSYPLIEEETGPQPMGAVEELARDDVARKKFLKMAGKGMGAATAASAFSVFLAACGSSKKTPQANSSNSTPPPTAGTTTGAGSGGGGDLAIANYALTLEYLETEFYKKVIAANLFSGKNAQLLKTFGRDEQMHVNALKKLITSKGGTPATKPQGKFPIKDAASVAMLAATVENLGAAAYLGQAANIQSKDVLAAALAIHTVEARHAAVLNTLTKQSITPDGAFAKPKSMSEVLAAVKPFLA